MYHRGSEYRERFVSRARILESTKHARERFSSRNTRGLCLLESRRPRQSRLPRASRYRALANPATYGRLSGVFSFFLSRTKGIPSGAARTTVPLFDRIDHKNEHTTTATQKNEFNKRASTRDRERARERASGRASRRSKARYTVVGVTSLAIRSHISPRRRGCNRRPIFVPPGAVTDCFSAVVASLSRGANLPQMQLGSS